MTFTEIEPVRGELAVILDSERQIEPQSAELRARAFARARVATLAGPLKARSKLAHGGFRWLVAASLLAAAATVWAARIHARRSVSRPAPSAAPPFALPAASSTHPFALTRAEMPLNPLNPLDSAAAAATSTPAPRSFAVSARAPSALALYALELKLLQPARVAVAAANFTRALSAIAEHARRFPNGQLAEEREALRVQALAGLHRTEEARRAAAAFSARFPGSVLLSRMKGAEEATP